MVVRKRLDIERPGLVFITTTVIEWQPIFLNDEIAIMTLKQLSETIRYYNGSVGVYCLMPPHLHAIIKLNNLNSLSNVMGSFKSLSSRKIKGQFPNLFVNWPSPNGSFHFWKTRFDDFIIRNMKQLEIKMNYIHENPVKAEIVNRAEDYRYSSAIDWAGGKGLIEVIVV